MACEMRTSVLPAILREYDSDYEPNYRTKSGKLTRKSAQTGTRRREDAGSPESQQQQPLSESAEAASSPAHQPPAPRDEVKSSKTDKSSTPEKQPRHSSKANNETERYCQLTAHWEEARRSVQAERHSALREKVALQKQLIRVQDSAAFQRRQALQELQAQAKDVARTEKQTKQAELQQICRQSLEDDKRLARRRPRDRGEGQLDENANASHGGAPTGSKAGGQGGSQPPAPQGHQPAPKKVGSLRAGRVVRSPNLPKSPMLEENEDDSDDERQKEVDLDSLPWHHAQLYRLYGTQAEYFIHPKMEPLVKAVNPRLKKHSAPYIGAEKLWDTLREESQYKIRNEDKRFPKELKEAYSAFVRESLRQDKKPVKRNFYASEDVPDMVRLLDQSMIQRVRLLKHRREIMYRASRNNMDRTNIIVYNNPMPNLSDTENPVGRYLPSWADTDDLGEVTCKDRELGDMSQRSEPGRKSLPAIRDESLNIILRDLHRPKYPPPPQYHFLTEEAARERGTFSEKFKQERENKNKPAPHATTMKAQSSLGFNEQRLPRQDLNGGSETARGLSRAMSTQEEVWRHCLSHWEPLSLEALVEYKQQKEVVGEGDFKQGRTGMWPVVLSPS